jgi:cell division protein FtsW
LAIILGLVFFYGAFKFPINNWLKYTKYLLAAAFGLTLLTLVMGGISNRWLQFGLISFQPIEYVKFIFMILLAYYLADIVRKSNDFNLSESWKEIVGAIILAIIVIFLQRDLGSTLVLFSMLGTMFLVSGIHLKNFIKIVVPLVIIVFIAIGSTSYRRERVLNFLEPTKDCNASGYQACQALVGIGSGGLMGVGVGNSVQDFGYLPESTNDSIFAVFAEKFGFIGCLVLISIYAGLLFKIINVIKSAPNRSLQLVAVGAFTWIFVQSAFNISAMIGLAPLKGIPLPFISYGGTSMVFSLSAIGVVFQISAYTNIRNNNFGFDDERGSNESINDRRGNSRPRYTVTRSSV